MMSVIHIVYIIVNFKYIIRYSSQATTFVKHKYVVDNNIFYSIFSDTLCSQVVMLTSECIIKCFSSSINLHCMNINVLL